MKVKFFLRDHLEKRVHPDTRAHRAWLVYPANVVFLVKPVLREEEETLVYQDLKDPQASKEKEDSKDWEDPRVHLVKLEALEIRAHLAQPENLVPLA
jgi:hypothetical protein